ncbi:MAG TPA: M14 family metallopeptidase [Longimicrobiales bacterium]|nr:M14 family metallopeptidase [Longimicrobiales bacterium]
MRAWRDRTGLATAMATRLGLLVLLVGMAVPVAAQVTPAGGGGAALDPVRALRTAPERTGFRETTRHDDVVAWMETVAAASPVIQLDTFGYSLQGRVLPMAIVGRLTDTRPETVRASGKTVVYLQGNIHAGEVEGKEVLLMMLREFALGEHHALLDSLVLLIVPNYNADGNEAVLLTNRPAQHGPVAGMGTRPNSQGLNLNRDHTKLTSPEARSLAQMLAAYDPHVGVDLHTTNGTRHGYYLTYSPPLHPNTTDGIVSLLRDDWLPHTTAEVSRKYDWDFYYYGNVQGQGEARGWYTFDHRPRFSNNYLGLRNRIGILSEAYSYATFEDRILATRRFVDEILAFAHTHAGRVRSVVAAAEAQPVIGQRLATRATFERSPEPVRILMGAVEEERNPYSGATMLRRLDVRTPEMMYEYGTFAATETAVVPAAYILLETSPQVLANLEAHGVRTRALGQARELEVERFRVDSTSLAPREFEGQRERTVVGEWVAASVAVPADAVVIDMDQPLARLLFTLLEPRSDDGLVNWNLFDRWLEADGTLPIVRSHRPVR